MAAATFCGASAGFASACRLGEAVEEDVVDHLIGVGRNLLVTDGVRHVADLLARVLEHLDEILARQQQLLGEGAREHGIGTVVVVGETVERGLLVAGREDREHAFRQLPHRREPAAAGDRARARALERIVAAGVEHEDRGAHALVLQPLDDAVGKHGGVADQLFLALGRRRNVGRQQIILAGDLEAMARIEEEGGVALADRIVEREQALAELHAVLVLGDHHGEAELLQRLAHGAGVVDGLLQLRHVPVVVVADHQRDALLGLRRRGERREKRPPAAPRMRLSAISKFLSWSLRPGRKCPLAVVGQAAFRVQSAPAPWRRRHLSITGWAKLRASAQSAMRVQLSACANNAG